ncbi:HSP20-like chaperone, partial [Catenaria anguillulae PL171]
MSLLRSSLMREPFAFGNLERSLRDIFNQVDRVMADVYGPAAAASSRALTSGGDPSSSLVSSAASAIPAGLNSFSPRLDVQETDDVIQVKADLPGVPKEAVQVTAKDGMLIISGETVKEKEQKDDQGNFVVRERFQGVFKRAVALPSTAKLDEVSAKYTDGVLSITVPKAEDQGIKQITV